MLTIEMKMHKGYTAITYVNIHPRICTHTWLHYIVVITTCCHR